MKPGGCGAQIGWDRGQVEPVQVDQLQQGAPGQVGEGVEAPGAAQHLQLVQGGQVGEGVRVVEVDRVAPQLNLLQILQVGENTAGDGGNGVTCKCAEKGNLDYKFGDCLDRFEPYILSTFFKVDREAGTSVRRLLLSSLKINI